jgi:hypothetical protein
LYWHKKQKPRHWDGAKLLIMVARGGIEPSTRGFSMRSLCLNPQVATRNMQQNQTLDRIHAQSLAFDCPSQCQIFCQTLTELSIGERCGLARGGGVKPRALPFDMPTVAFVLGRCCSSKFVLNRAVTRCVFVPCPRPIHSQKKPDHTGPANQE